MSKYKKVNVPIIVQLEEQEGGAACLDMILAYYKKGEKEDINPDIEAAIMNGDFPLSRRVMEGKSLFSGNFITENMIYFYVGVRRLFYHR